MENLLQFIKRFSLLLLFLALETVAIIMLVQFNSYQRSVLFSSANWVSGGFYQVVDAVGGYFNLREVNQSLSAENAALKNEIERLKAQQPALVSSTDSVLIATADTTFWQPYSYVAAHVIQHSINKAQNYITLNKGTDDGILPDMGVVSPDGVVGIVKSASRHYAMVIPIINVQSRISCRLDSTQNFGSLVWDASDYRTAILQEVPGHATVKIGETVSTSGFSAIFPSNIPVGKVSDVTLIEENQFLQIKVDLSVDFGKLAEVNVIQFAGNTEFKALQ
ncbi:MAG: rod shape-determining protein MreC [Paludibacteraceae bacterium]|nr:rod shape-determining protein MreC [Paludibacteraceae bacterium]